MSANASDRKWCTPAARDYLTAVLSWRTHLPLSSAHSRRNSAHSKPSGAWLGPLARRRRRSNGASLEEPPPQWSSVWRDGAATYTGASPRQTLQNGMQPADALFGGAGAVYPSESLRGPLSAAVSVQLRPSPELPSTDADRRCDVGALLGR